MDINQKGKFEYILTVCQILLRFVSLLDSKDDCWKAARFWEKYCQILKEDKGVQMFLCELQTLLLLYGFHMHLMVDKKQCPTCSSCKVTLGRGK